MLTIIEHSAAEGSMAFTPQLVTANGSYKIQGT